MLSHKNSILSFILFILPINKAYTFFKKSQAPKISVLVKLEAFLSSIKTSAIPFDGVNLELSSTPLYSPPSLNLILKSFFPNVLSVIVNCNLFSSYFTPFSLTISSALLTIFLLIKNFSKQLLFSEKPAFLISFSIVCKD